EIRRLPHDVVRRLLVHEAHAVIECEPIVHLPVVLNVAFRVVEYRLRFDECCRLQERTEASDRRICKPERRIEWIGARGVLRETQIAERRTGKRGAAALRVRRLQRMTVVEPSLERMASGNLRQADR